MAVAIEAVRGFDQARIDASMSDHQSDPQFKQRRINPDRGISITPNVFSEIATTNKRLGRMGYPLFQEAGETLETKLDRWRMPLIRLSFSAYLELIQREAILKAVANNLEASQGPNSTPY